MTSPENSQLRTDFLSRLDHAMRSIPHGVAREIRAGIAEELDGLDGEQLRARIAALGSPDDIADQALAEVSPQVAVERKRPIFQSKGFAIAAALTFGFGGFLVPVAGFFAGVVLVFLSEMWRRWEKLVAVMLPVAVLAVLTVVSVVYGALSSATVAGDADNPLVPSGLGIWHSSVLGVIVIIPVAGIWLLWRLRRRGE